MAGERVEGVPTGFPDLDRKLHGLVPGRMVIVAARPGHGKSTLALNVAEHIAWKERGGVAFFSLEMSEEELADKLLIARAGIDSDSYMEGKIERSDQERIVRAANELDSAPIYIDDSSNQTLGGIRSAARQLQARESQRGGLGLVVVDYLQLINPPRTGREVNRTAEVSEISRGLKLLASELDVPFLVCAQLNRAPEGRVGKRPVLADLRESGAIEADANQVLLLFREEVYEEFPEEPGVCEVQVAKNRHGQGGMVKLLFQGEHSRFRSMIREAA
jgi:replicative DNA helicase